MDFIFGVLAGLIVGIFAVWYYKFGTSDERFEVSRYINEILDYTEGEITESRVGFTRIKFNPARRSLEEMAQFRTKYVRTHAQVYQLEPYQYIIRSSINIYSVTLDYSNPAYITFNKL